MSNVRRSFIPLENNIHVELLKFWPDLSVQQLILNDPFDSFIINVLWTYHIIAPTREIHFAVKFIS